MFDFKIALLLTIVSSSFFVNCTGNSDVFSALRYTFGNEFDHMREFFAKGVIEDRQSNVDGHYNDTKCYEEMAILIEALNATEAWALNGKPTKIKFERNDMKTMIHRFDD